MSGQVEFVPSMSAIDEEHFFEVREETAVNNRFGGKQVLYADPQFPGFVYDMIVRGEEGYITGYDGYAFYQEMSWSPLQAPNEGRGLFTTVPADSRVDRSKGYIGWACFYNDSRSYDCGRYHVTEE